MTDHDVPDDPAERLFETLDELAGFDASEDLEQELREAEPVALSPGFAERTRAEIQALEARRVDAVGVVHRRHSWWIAASIALCLLACVPFVFEWSGRRSTRELNFEHALAVVQDERYSDNSRHAAFMTAAIHIKTGISTIKRRVATNPQLAPDVDSLFTALRAASDTPAKARGKKLEPGTLARVLNEFNHGEDEAAAAALPVFHASVEYGLGVLHEARTLGPRFARDFRSQRSKIRLRLD